MINTYQTSLAPPPVPPRLSRPESVLVPMPLTSQGRSKPLLLVTLMLLQFLLTVGGFVYLYYNGKLDKMSPEAAAGYVSLEKEMTARRIVARMMVKKRTRTDEKSDYLQWDIKHSFRRDISYYHNIWLTVQQPGDYYVYSRVTFSKGSPRMPLASKVKLRKNETGAVETVMQAFCSLTDRVDDSGASVPHLCTATQGDVIALESGNQLSVWVQDLTLVNYEAGATTFGMYKL
ncbi:CD40 ligand [Takifugu flavidus]|uniref:THD domain-containing protein n=1 Tax=Takifugu bimaculatus TaxID=433685 RepID=A0A4Z2C446_9TELE|nr:CD40 ligand [Takifugu flavidus]TNM99134.1 hypothetical protein fugu_013698 [Takifugu bimaculatus]